VSLIPKANRKFPGAANGLKVEEERLDLLKGKSETFSEKPLRRVDIPQMEFWRHWRRFWCCYLLGSIIFLAVFLPVL
jgi:hypothetical protein